MRRLQRSRSLDFADWALVAKRDANDRRVCPIREQQDQLAHGVLGSSRRLMPGNNVSSKNDAQDFLVERLHGRAGPVDRFWVIECSERGMLSFGT
jgi:hypothetical protein